MKKILSLLLVLVLAVGVMTSCEDILSKIPGFGGDDHVCESPCERCGKCTDLECESKACSNKCYGHIIPPPAHKCESACPECGKCTDASCSNTVCKEKCAGHTTGGSNWAEDYETITIAEAIELAKAAGEKGESDRYVRGTIKKMLNITYGEMTLADETGEIYVFGVYGQDGTQYAQLAEKAVEGDEVLLYCTTINTYNGTPQVKRAELVDFKHVEVEIDPSEYPTATIAEARAAKTGDKVKVTGVVARITYANGMKPSGVVIVDGADSIYIYDQNIAGQVSIGNKIEVAASKTYWILETEQSNAEKFGYKGCNQLENATLVSNDKGNNTWINDSIAETTVKAIMDTPVTEDITTQVYKVNALVKKVVGTGFTNYYFFDIDGETGAYTYTQCNGGDFAWLDQFDGKICTVYLTALNAKSENSNCFFRLLPLEVIDEGYTFNTDDAAKYAVQYHGVTQFESSYSGAKTLDVQTSVSSELLGFEGATLSYSSSDESIIKFTESNGVVTMSCLASGQAVITVKGAFGGKEYSETLTITVDFPNGEVESLTVGEAIDAAVGTEVVVKGIVGPSLVNKSGFYLIDETGVIAIQMDASILATLEIGNEVILKGTRANNTKGGTTYFGQTNIEDCTVVVNNYGSHEYSTVSFIDEGKTLGDIYNLNPLEDHSTDVYVVKAIVEWVETDYYSSVKLVNAQGETLGLYCSGAGQYSWLSAFAGQEVTMEIAACNWNDKTYYRGCVLAVILEDGTKVYNTLSFDTAK